MLRVAPKITFSSIVKPVCLPLPDESLNDAATSTKDLLFASHAAASDQNDGDGSRETAVTESSVTSLISSSVRDQRKTDLNLVTDQRLEIPESTCAQILEQSGMGWMVPLLLRDQSSAAVMCALNSPLFTLNCRVII